MFSLKNLKLITNIFIILLIGIKLITVINDRTEVFFFVIWSLPFIIFSYFAHKLSIKSYQSFSFILLIYFMSSSLRVFGITPYIFDLLELILIVLFFVHCMLGPKTIRNQV